MRASMSLPHYEDASGVLEIKQAHLNSQFNSSHSKTQHTHKNKKLIQFIVLLHIYHHFSTSFSSPQIPHFETEIRNGVFSRWLPSLTFWVTVKVFPVSRGTVQFTGSGDRMIICSGDFTLVGSGGLFTTGSSSIHGLAAVADTGGWVCDGGVEATLESPPVTSPFT